MAEWTFEDVALTYAIRGQGEPVVLVHASPFVEWYDPLVGHLPDFEVMTYRRRLRTDRQAGFRPLTAAEDAAICARLMAHVGWPRAHVAGHSNALAIAVGEADQFFQAEMPAVRQFSFGPDEARRIRAPVFNVGGSDSVDRFVHVGDLVQSWFPHAERLTVPDVGHLLMVQNPSALAS